jgi:hypothetical protein
MNEQNEKVILYALNLTCKNECNDCNCTPETYIYFAPDDAINYARKSFRTCKVYKLTCESYMDGCASFVYKGDIIYIGYNNKDIISDEIVYENKI